MTPRAAFAPFLFYTESVSVVKDMLLDWLDQWGIESSSQYGFKKSVPLYFSSPLKLSSSF